MLARVAVNDQYMLLTAGLDGMDNATQWQTHLLLAAGRRLSSQTVRNMLPQGGLYARKLKFCILLTSQLCGPKKVGN